MLVLEVCLQTNKMWAIDDGKIRIVEAKGFNRYWGLMFRLKPLVLHWEFKEPTNISIHSAFCRKFFAIWLDKKNNIIEIRLVKPFQFNIKPKKKFSKLIEIPLSFRIFS